MHADRVFFDTNILVYLAGSDETKADIASALVRDGGVISVQVLNEHANVMRKKAGLSIDELVVSTETLSSLLTVVPNDLETHRLGLDLMRSHNFSLYDAMIVAAAYRSDCSILYSEDMQNG